MNKYRIVSVEDGGEVSEYFNLIASIKDTHLLTDIQFEDKHEGLPRTSIEPQDKIYDFGEGLFTFTQIEEDNAGSLVITFPEHMMSTFLNIDDKGEKTLILGTGDSLVTLKEVV